MFHLTLAGFKKFQRLTGFLQPVLIGKVRKEDAQRGRVSCLGVKFKYGFIVNYFEFFMLHHADS